MRFPYKKRLLTVAAFAAISGLSSSAFALAPACVPGDLVNPIYGAGGSAVTATLKQVAKALVSLPEDERVTILYSDPSACTGYNFLVKPTATAVDFWYFKNTEAGPEAAVCSAPGNLVTFSHMGNTSTLCGDGSAVPAGFASYVAPVQSINLITSIDSQYKSISAEALYHIYGFGPGAVGHDVAPWTVPNAVFGRKISSFVHLLVASAINVPPTSFNIPGKPSSPSPNNFLDTNEQTVVAVNAWGLNDAVKAQQPLGYVSGSAADLGQKNGLIKTLAYQDYGQTCGYLPDTSPTVKDKLNVRTGQYALFTQGWFYAKLGDDGQPAEDVAKIIHWFDGTLESPDDLAVNVGTAENPRILTSVKDIIIDSGDVPLCAMQVLRTEGDYSPIVSYANPTPCNGYFEKFATGTTDHAQCDESSDCEGENEQCFWGFCEVTYPESTDPN